VRVAGIRPLLAGSIAVVAIATAAQAVPLLSDGTAVRASKTSSAPATTSVVVPTLVPGELATAFVFPADGHCQSDTSVTCELPSSALQGLHANGTPSNCFMGAIADGSASQPFKHDQAVRATLVNASNGQYLQANGSFAAQKFEFRNGSLAVTEETRLKPAGQQVGNWQACLPGSDGQTPAPALPVGTYILTVTGQAASTTEATPSVLTLEIQ
jgi:hypothetical protein